MAEIVDCGRTGLRFEPGDPAEFVPGARRDIDDLDGYIDFLVLEIYHDGLRALYAREELQPLARLEDDPVPERVHALPVGAGQRDPLERQRHRPAVRTALAAARGNEGRR